MKIVYFGTFYQGFLNNFYLNNPNFSNLDYKDQYQLILSENFGNWGAFPKYANRIEGISSQLIIPNCKIMQKQWAYENDVKFDENNWEFSIAIEQIKKIKPDIFFIGSMFKFYGAFLEEISKYSKKIYGWISCPIPSGLKTNNIELILTSHHIFCENFRKTGLNSEILPAAFDIEVLDSIPKISTQDIPFSFVGGLSGAHSERYNLLRNLVIKTNVGLWGYGIDNKSLNLKLRSFAEDVYFSLKTKNIKYFSKKFIDLLVGNPLLKVYHGEVFGNKMYDVLSRSKITLNSHIDIAGNWSGNMRMFEATGVGSLLLTDFKDNLNSIFEIDKEVVSYKSIDEAIEKVNYYLSHDVERRAIALAGQKRTLMEYNMTINMQRMLEYFYKYLK